MRDPTKTTINISCMYSPCNPCPQVPLNRQHLELGAPLRPCMVIDKQRLQLLVNLVAYLKKEKPELPPRDLEANRTRLRLVEATLELLAQQARRISSFPDQNVGDWLFGDPCTAQASEVSLPWAVSMVKARLCRASAGDRRQADALGDGGRGCEAAPAPQPGHGDTAARVAEPPDAVAAGFRGVW
jgi:hypothetical protein